MPRRSRIHYPGALYHVISRGNNRQATFLSPEDYQSFLRHLRRVQHSVPFDLYAYCLMPNHFHLLVEVNIHPLSKIIQRLLTGYTVYFNHSHERGGHLFQGRYKAFLCEKDAYLLELVRYIHLNPVRAKLVKIPGSWKWSGHRAYLDGKNDFLSAGTVLAQFSQQLSRARTAYAAFVRAGVAQGHRNDLYPEEKVPYLGGDEFIVQSRIRQEFNHQARASSPRQELAVLLREICRENKISPNVLLGKSRLEPVAALRKKFIIKAYSQGHRPSDIGRFLDRSQPFVTKIVR